MIFREVLSKLNSPKVILAIVLFFSFIKRCL
jgi:hypothetical protein